MAEEEDFKLDQNKLTLQLVIEKIRKIADTEFEGKVYDSILTIFNRLTTKEKRIFLRGLVNICFILGNSLTGQMDSSIERKQTIDSELRNIEDLNQAENLKLRTWLVKVFVIVSFCSLLLVFLFLFFFDGNINGIWDTLSNLYDTLHLLLLGN